MYAPDLLIFEFAITRNARDDKLHQREREREREIFYDRWWIESFLSLFLFKKTRHHIQHHFNEFEFYQTEEREREVFIKIQKKTNFFTHSNGRAAFGYDVTEA